MPTELTVKSGQLKVWSRFSSLGDGRNLRDHVTNHFCYLAFYLYFGIHVSCALLVLGFLYGSLFTDF